MPTTVSWGGYTWDVRNEGLSTPGPNYWSNSADNVEVDGTELVVSIVHNGPSGAWTSTEVTCQDHLGYGTYKWIVNSALNALDPNDVLGMFTYGGPSPSFNEIDIEASRWGNPIWPSGSGTVWQDAGANERVFGEFDWTGTPPYTCQFTWEPNRVTYLVTDGADLTLFEWTLADGDIADAGFSDNFNFGTIPNYTHWRRWGAIRPTLSSGHVLIQSLASGVEYAGIATARTYDMEGATCMVRVMPSPVSGSHECSFEIVKPDESERVMMALSGTWLYHGISGALVEDRPYNASGDAWWRIVENEGTVTFYTSPDGSSWTTLGVATAPTWMDEANVQLAAGHFSAQPANTQTRFDNFSLATTGAAGEVLIPDPSTEVPHINYWRNTGAAPSFETSIRLASFEFLPLSAVDLAGTSSGISTDSGSLLVTAPEVTPLPPGEVIVVPSGAYLPDIYPNYIGDEAYADFRPLLEKYGDPDEALRTFVGGLGNMFKQVDDIASDGAGGEPGWSQIFDLERAKTTWLPWAGQIVGCFIPQRPDNQTLAEYDAIQRARVVERSNWIRGTVHSMITAAQDHLNPPRRVIVQERVGDDPWVIYAYVFSGQIRTSVAEVTRAIITDKVAGLLLEFNVLTGNDYLLLRASNDDYADVKATHATYESAFINPGLES